MGKSNNTRLHLHVQNCYRDTRVEPVDETHQIIVWTLATPPHSRLYAPQFFDGEHWSYYRSASGLFASWVEDNARKYIEDNRRTKEGWLVSIVGGWEEEDRGPAVSEEALRQLRRERGIE